MIFILLKRRIKTIRNELYSLDGWEMFKRSIFTAAGIAILAGLYFGFLKVLRYLEGVSIIGPLLSWKLASMAFLTTFVMIAISGLIIAMTTLYYSRDLKFLFAAPLNMRVLFVDKAMETSFYSSWTLAAVMLPFVFALGSVKGAGPGFYFSFLVLLIPFVLIGTAFGIMFSMLLMYIFPTSRTRDVVWGLSSVSLALVYVAIRFSQPEKLIHPDTLEVVAQYLQYLQAPTAEYLPSWWLTRAMMSLLGGNLGSFAGNFALLFLCAAVIYGLMTYLAGILYMKGFSGAQGVRRFRGGNKPCIERRLVHWALRLKAKRGFAFRSLLTLYWKDRKIFVRDARYWSQIILVFALVAVYLFSIKQLPLDSPNVRSFVSFLNIGIAGFVVAAIGLRFTFPAISLEGKSWWISKSAPLSLESIMREKFVFSVLPSVVLGGVLVIWSNRILHADAFISVLSAATIILCAVGMSVMGVGLGAAFPKFDIENVHQIESSSGGFIYMACCLGYLGATIAIEAWPVKMHFFQAFAGPDLWDWQLLYWCAAFLLALNIAVMAVPWRIGLQTLKK